MKAKRLKHYKPARFKAHKKPMDRRILIVIISALAMIAASVALGAYLHTIATDPAADTGSADTQTQEQVHSPYDAYPKLGTARAGYRMLEGYAYLSDDDANTALLRANGALVHSLCFNLLDSTGRPSYKSGAYNRALSAESGQIDLGLFLERAEKNSIAVTAAMPVLSMSGDYADISGMRSDIELMIISEAYSLGLRELTLTGISGADADTLYSYVSRIKEHAPELRVGGCFTLGELSSDSIYTAKTDDIFDFICVDFSAEFGQALQPVTDGGSADSGTDTGTDTEAEADGAFSGRTLAESIERAAVTMGRYRWRIYIEAGDGCGHCTSLAMAVLSSVGADDYMLVLSEPWHDDGSAEQTVDTHAY